MTSFPTSSVHTSFKYDVFLSFRGEDTRKNFVDHLYSTLQQKGIHTYKDDVSINKGKRISDELMGSIEDSKFYIIVFSKNYASSTWCLNELLKIMECQKATTHIVYPVFYDVEPSEVRNQIGAFGEAFVKHEKEEDAVKWREALKEATDIAGWELKNTADGHEAKVIRQIVEQLSLELRSISVCIDENLVGMKTRINNIVSSLGTDSNDVHMIGIWGIGGGGKTTLARAIYNKVCLEFEGRSFIENIKEVSNASLSGLRSLQKQILSDVLNNQGINISSENEGKSMIGRMMCGRKVLVVLDDVDHTNQLEALAGDRSWFNPGSIIMITTRDEQVLVAHGVRLIYNVELLSNMEAICLFSKYAFGRDIPIQRYDELSRQVVRYAAGLPLTIKVLGSFLCGKTKREWKDALERLKTIPLKETLKKLELSYIGLEEDYKEIFLHVACILKGELKHYAIEFLESCGFHAKIGLRVLEQKSLITIVDTYDDERVDMHYHLEEMGKNIVRRSHPDMPNTYSRLWDSKEIEHILANDLGTDAIRCIKFNKGRLDSDIIMKGLRKMKELRILDVALKDFYANRETNDQPMPNFLYVLGFLCSNWKSNESPYFPDALQYLRWDKYHFRYLPKTFLANNLVSLEMAECDIEQLWEGGERKVLDKLRFLDLGYSMLRTFDLGLTPNLEKLTLRGCSHLAKLRITVECVNLRYLKLDGSLLTTLDLELTPNLEFLDLNNCYNLVKLHLPNGFLKLKYLNLRGSKLRTLDLGLARDLRTLFLFNCNELVELHMPHSCLNLKSLLLNNLKFRTLNIGLTPNLDVLSLTSCYYLEELHTTEGCEKLTSLFISRSKLRSLNLGLAPNLEALHLQECDHLVKLHIPSICVNLRSIVLYNSKLRAFDLALTPNIKSLYLQNCIDMVALHAQVGWLRKLVDLELSSCFGFTCFSFHIKDYTSGRMKKSMEGRSSVKLHFTLERCPFHPYNNLQNFKFTSFHEEDLPSLTRNLEKLISIGPCACTKFETFSKSICELQR